MQALSIGTVLHQGTYRIEKALGQGSSGITYLATDLNLQRMVAIKEFFLIDYCHRNDNSNQVTLGSHSTTGLVCNLRTKFLKEARHIAKLDYPGIISIHAAFEENNTAYYVMDYIEGESLSEIVSRKGSLPVDRALRYIRGIGDALTYIHERKINHLDIKPANIMIRRSDDNPILIDFGLSKHYDSEGKQTSTTPTGISHGFAPLEQYNYEGVTKFSPQSDIYSLAATLYFLLSGIVPLQATRLVDEELTFPPGIPVYLIDPLFRAMSSKRRNRQQTVAEFILELEISGNKKESTIHPPSSSVETKEILTGTESDTSPIPTPDMTSITESEDYADSDVLRKYSSKKILFTIMAFILAVGLGTVFWFNIDSNTDSTLVAKEFEQSPSGNINGHAFIDLGLPSGLKWASCNLGAMNSADYGSYYAWGETAPKSSYKKTNSLTYGKDISTLHLAGIIDQSGNLSPDYDAARVAWGGSWRIPTKDEIQELLSKCKWTWTTRYGHKGHNVTGPNGNSIFLPASGFYGNIYNGGSRLYWSSTPNKENNDFAFHLGNTDVNKGLRYHGFTIRPVSE